MQLLDKVGEDLASYVKSNNLPILQQLDEPVIGKNNRSLFDVTMHTLGRVALNSPILVGGDAKFIETYLNTLSVVMDQKDHFEEILRNVARIGNDKIIKNLIDKRLHTFEVSKFLSLSSSTDEQRGLFTQIAEEGIRQEYFLVISQLHFIIPPYQDDREQHLTLYRNLFWAVRSPGLAFIFVMSWEDYIDLERRLPAFARYCPGIPLSPRPPDLPSDAE